MVGVWDDVEVSLRRSDVGVARPFFDDRKVETGSEELRGVGVDRVMDSDTDHETGGFKTGQPRVVLEPRREIRPSWSMTLDPLGGVADEQRGIQYSTQADR